MITSEELDRKIRLSEERMAHRVRSGELFFQHHKEHQSGGKDALTTSAASLTVTEPDGSPSVSSVNTIKFSNGTVTDDGSGVVTVSTGGSSSGGTPAVVLASAVAAGAAATFLRTDDTIKAFDTTVPSTQAFGDSAAVGTAAFAARRDHKHAMMASPTNALLDGTAHTDTVAQTVSRGSLIYGNSTPKWDELVIGSSGKFLYSDGTDASWRTPLYTDVGAASKTRVLRIPVADMWPSQTAGAGRTVYNGVTNAMIIPTLDFNGTAISYAEFVARLVNWDGGTVTAMFVWMANTTSATDTVYWACAGRSYGDSETLDQALGTLQSVTDDASTTAYQVMISAATSAITLAGTPAAGEFVRFRIHRDPTQAADDMSVDARLLEVRITYTEA